LLKNFYQILDLKNLLKKIIKFNLYNCQNNHHLNGDWGLGIGDWAQSPIPNPHTGFLIYALNL
jgi:hypothetical protein